MTTKTLTGVEIETVLTYLSQRKHSTRNRVLIMMNHYLGMKVNEISKLTIGDVVDSNNQIKDYIDLPPNQYGHSHTVLINETIRTELTSYLKICNLSDHSRKLFYTQKNPVKGFSPNTLTQFFFYAYKDAGITGASSHSGRKGFINALAKNGTDVHIIQKLTGHSTLQSVKDQIIIDDLEQQKKQAVDLIKF
jgi:integrase/recombinase XerD